MREGRGQTGSGCCDPEELFDFAEGNLDFDRGREVRHHLEDCPSCKARYDREAALSAGFCAGNASRFGCDAFAPKDSSTSREVAMRIPVRSVAARMVWGMLSLGILSITLFALFVFGVDPLGLATGGASTLFGYVAAASDVSTLIIAFVAPFLLAAFAVGLVLDIVIAAVVLLAARRGGTVRTPGHTRGA